MNLSAHVSRRLGCRPRGTPELNQWPAFSDGVRVLSSDSRVTALMSQSWGKAASRAGRLPASACTNASSIDTVCLALSLNVLWRVRARN